MTRTSDRLACPSSPFREPARRSPTAPRRPPEPTASFVEMEQSFAPSAPRERGRYSPAMEPTDAARVLVVVVSGLVRPDGGIVPQCRDLPRARGYVSGATALTLPIVRHRARGCGQRSRSFVGRPYGESAGTAGTQFRLDIRWSSASRAYVFASIAWALDSLRPLPSLLMVVAAAWPPQLSTRRLRSALVGVSGCLDRCRLAGLAAVALSEPYEDRLGRAWRWCPQRRRVARGAVCAWAASGVHRRSLAGQRRGSGAPGGCCLPPGVLLVAVAVAFGRLMSTLAPSSVGGTRGAVTAEAGKSTKATTVLPLAIVANGGLGLLVLGGSDGIAVTIGDDSS